VFRILSECKDNKEKLERWLRCIPRDDVNVTEYTVVCIKHFASRFIITEDSATRPDGSIITVPRKVPKLTSDAYPSIFENCPSYLSSEPPAKRRDPDERRRNVDERSEQLFEEWMENDRVSSLASLKEQLRAGFVLEEWKCVELETCVIMYVLDISSVNQPSVKVSITVHADLSVCVCHCGHVASADKLTWVLGGYCKLDCMSKLTSLLSFLRSESIPAVDDRLGTATKILSELCDDDCRPMPVNANEVDEGDSDKMARALRHLHEQCALWQQSQPRYSVELLRWAFQIFSLSPPAYAFIRESCLILPHPIYLRGLAAGFNMEAGIKQTSHAKYLEQKCKLLEEHERLVSLLLDEIYVNPKITFKAGNLDGFANNTSSMMQATTVQAFMISSLLSNNTDMAALVPVKNIDSKFLLDTTIDVIKIIEQAGYKVVCIISDNNKLNGNMFAAFAGGKLTNFIDHPLDPARKLFFLFDSVHLLKCIRNNWINQRDAAQTLTYPDLHNEGSTELHRACFAAVKQLYESEKNCSVKQAPSLSQKALYPSSTERQNVQLALCVFNDKTVTALDRFGDKEKNCDAQQVIYDTRDFIDIILKLWKLLNVKHPLKGRNLRDIDCDPIRSVDDHQLLYFDVIVMWLDRWGKSNLQEGILTKETLCALKHTVETMICLSKYLLVDLQFKYVLTGKFQTDKLEYRFSQYRRLAGTNYHVSVREIMESEKKLKLVSMLHLKSPSVGCISIAQFSLECMDSRPNDSDDCDINDSMLHEFKSVIAECDQVVISEAEMQVLVFISGYIGRKLKMLLCCSDCIAEYVTDEGMTCDIAANDLVYLHSLDRGGLCWPTQLLVDNVVRVFLTFQRLISNDHEHKFIVVKDHKAVLMHLSMQGIREQCCVSGTCECGRSYLDVLKLCVSKMSNISLNNYMKRLNDQRVAACAKDKAARKLKTLNNKS
jgi:hypothetical protein